MDDFLQGMGKRILLRRKELKLSQEDVAERTDLTSQTISTAERGEKALRPENIVKICAALGITPNYLLLGEAAEVPSRDLPLKIAKLSPTQMRYLETIIDSYVSAVTGLETDTQ